MMFFPVFKFILYSSIVGSILGVFILIIKKILGKKFSVRIQYWMWFILIIKLIIPSGFERFHIVNLNRVNTKIIQAQKYNPLIVKNYRFNLNKRETSVNIHENVKKNIEDKKSKYCYEKRKTFNFTFLYIVWIIGMCLYGILFMAKLCIFCRKLSREKICEKLEIQDMLKECKRNIRINLNIRIINTDILKTPAIFGFLKPKLLLPVSIESTVSKDELRYILIHELCHLKRRDTIVSFIIGILQILHWFNPILWYLFNRFREDSEIACDDLVLSYLNGEERREYGYTIIKLLSICNENKYIYSLRCLSNNKNQIKRRIMMISLFKKTEYKKSIIAFCILIGLVIGVGINFNGDVVKSLSVDNENISKAKDVVLHSIKNEKFIGKILIIPKNKKIVVGFNKKSIENGTTVSESAKENNAICAINAGGFIKSIHKEKVTPYGIVVHDGKILYSDFKDKNIKENIVGFNKNGMFIMGKFTLDEINKLNIKEGVSYTLDIICNGKLKDISKGGIAPRTAIGEKKDGTILFLTIDGEVNDKKVGCSIDDIQNILRKFGAHNAVNLDGGQSTSMYYDENLITKNSDKSKSLIYKKNKERIIPTTFMVLPK